MQLQNLLGKKADTPSEPSAGGNPLAALAGYAGEVRLTADEIRLPSALVLKDSQATLLLADERLEIAGLQIGFPEGQLAGELMTGPLSARI